VGFDTALLQVVDVTQGPDWNFNGTRASFLIGAGQTKAQAIAEANTTGTLQNVANFFFPGSGFVAPGDHVAFTVTMKAKAGANGASAITLGEIQATDFAGGGISEITSTGGSVTVGSAATETSTATGTPTATNTTDTGGSTPTSTPTPTRTATNTPSITATTSAGNSTLKVSPASQTVAVNAEFVVNLLQKSDVVTTGVGADVEFDQELLELKSVEKGTAYANGAIVAGISPQTMAQAISEANDTGKLLNLAAYFVPGTGTVAAGTEAVAVKLTFQALSGETGSSDITLTELEMLDAAGDALTVTPTNGQVTVSSSVTSTATPSGTTTGTPSVTGTATPAGTPQATLAVDPATVVVPPGANFQVQIKQTANFVTTGAQASVTFDQTKVELVSIEKGQPYGAASLLAGVAPQTVAAAIAEANSSGKLNKAATFFVPGTGQVPTGQAVFLLLNMKAKDGASGSSALTLSDLEMLNAEGDGLTVGGQNGSVSVQVGAPVPTPISSVAGSTTTSSAAGGSRTSASSLPNAGDGNGNGARVLGISAVLLAALASGGWAFGRRMAARRDD
jgi:hypothetical protein